MFDFLIRHVQQMLYICIKILICYKYNTAANSSMIAKMGCTYYIFQMTLLINSEGRKMISNYFTNSNF